MPSSVCYALSFVLVSSLFVVSQDLMEFLGKRKGLTCKISGKAALGETSSTMGDFSAKLADRIDAPHKGSPGTFFLDTTSGQAEVCASSLCSHQGLFTVRRVRGAFTRRYSLYIWHFFVFQAAVEGRQKRSKGWFS